MSDLTITYAGSTVTTTSDTSLAGGAVIKVTPAVQASAEYGANDLVCIKTEIPKAVRQKGGVSIIRNVTIYQDVTTDVDYAVLFFDNDTGIGAAINGATSGISDAEFKAAGCIGGMPFDGAGGDNVGNGRFLYGQSQSAYQGLNQPLLVQAASAQTSLWFVVMTVGTAVTYEAVDGLQLTFNVEYL